MLTNPIPGLLVTVCDIHRNHFCAKQNSHHDKYGVWLWQVCIKFVATMASLGDMYTSKDLCYWVSLLIYIGVYKF
jgi:hypothetical protein